jgi:hypothetical protein
VPADALWHALIAGVLSGILAKVAITRRAPRDDVDRERRACSALRALNFRNCACTIGVATRHPHVRLRAGSTTAWTTGTARPRPASWAFHWCSGVARTRCRPLRNVQQSTGWFSSRVLALYLGAIGYAGTGPRPAQVSQISWPRCTLLGVALQGCPTAQISGTGVVVPR